MCQNVDLVAVVVVTASPECTHTHTRTRSYTHIHTQTDLLVKSDHHNIDPSLLQQTANMREIVSTGGQTIEIAACDVLTQRVSPFVCFSPLLPIAKRRCLSPWVSAVTRSAKPSGQTCSWNTDLMTMECVDAIPLKTRLENMHR